MAGHWTGGSGVKKNWHEKTSQMGEVAESQGGKVARWPRWQGGKVHSWTLDRRGWGKKRENQSNGKKFNKLVRSMADDMTRTQLVDR